MTDEGEHRGLRVVEGGREGEPVVRTREGSARPGRYCSHPSLELVVEHRRVLCVDCGAVLDPFASLLSIADQWERHAAWTRAMVRERRQAEAKLEEIKRELANAKARRRTAVKRGDLPPPRA